MLAFHLIMSVLSHRNLNGFIGKIKSIMILNKKEMQTELEVQRFLKGNLYEG